MDHMDIDEVLDVPDTPDRLAMQNITAHGGLEKPNISLTYGLSGKGKLFYEESKNQPESSDNVSRKKTHLLRHFNRSGKSSLNGHSISLNTPLFSREESEKGLSHGNNYSGWPNLPSETADPTERSRHASVLNNSFSKRDPGISQAAEFKEGSATDSHSSYSKANCSLKLNDVNEARHHNVSGRVDANLDCMHHVDSNNDARLNAPVGVSPGLSSVTLPRGTRQKRLVRNGCISPINIAKGKQPVSKYNGVSVGGPSPLASNTSAMQIHGRDIVASHYNSHSFKGKGVLNHPFSISESDVRCTHKSNRNSLKINEKASQNGDASRHIENVSKPDGWRRTHSQSGRVKPLMYRQDQHIPIDDGGSFFVNQYNRSMVMQQEGEENERIVLENSDGQISDASAAPARQTSSHVGPQSGENNGSIMAKNILAKRQKHGSSLTECSSSAADDSDIIFLGSTESRLARNQNHTDGGLTESVITIHEVTPEVQHVNSLDRGCSGSNEDTTVTQIELDEMLARELQEQFYNEDSAIGIGENNARTPLALQQEEELDHTSTLRELPASNPRRWLRHDLSAGARGPTSSRMARPSNRFPGRPRTLVPSRGRNSTLLPSRGRNSLFPAEMDVDMRMHILEALESFSDFGVDSSYLQMQRDFNENDYEMLLALDENNHQHGGATTRQINGLPQSTVQIGNLEEACAICLECPTMGDVIRHLPCLHKFHKDCIDPWLRRRTNCPVCKSSIT